MSRSAQEYLLPWEPVAKARARVAVVNGKARGYTPAKTRHAEAAMRYLLQTMGATPFPAGTPLSVDVRFEVARPTSAPKRVQYPVKRPDIDNFLKSVLDAADGLLWHDDAQIVSLRASKVFAASTPQIWIRVEDAGSATEHQHSPADTP